MVDYVRINPVNIDGIISVYHKFLLCPVTYRLITELQC